MVDFKRPRGTPDTTRPGPGHPDRRVGVEIEFAGLTEAETARIVIAALGGTPERSGPYDIIIHDTAIGTMRVELDTAWQSEIADAPGLVAALAHQVIPVELITDPLPEHDLPRLDQLAADLRHAGAEGSRAALVNGFGVHFNPELTSLTLPAILPVAQAWALLEPWLRHHEPMGLARRALPFTAPWPDRLRRHLLDLDPARDTLTDLLRLYLDLAPSRNFGLDLLPLLRQIAPDRVTAHLGDDAPGARPTWHFRLPSCRIDEPGWTITGEWHKWQLVEALASDTALLTRLSNTWKTRFSARAIGTAAAWVEHLDQTLTSPPPKGAPA